MARCLGPNSPYGCGHHAEHVEAAKKGWITRRAGAEFRSSEEHGAVSALLGKRITLAHEHSSHAGFTVFKSGNNWYEVPTKVFKQHAKAGSLLQGVYKTMAEQERHLDERNERIYQAEVARLEKIKDRERAQKEKRAAQQRYKEEQYRLKYERQRERQEIQRHASADAQYQEIVHSIRAFGGIRPDKAPTSSKGQGPGKRYTNYEEWQDLPRSVRTLQGIGGKRGRALDDLVDELNGEYLGIHFSNGDELAQYLQRQATRQRNRKFA